LVLVTFSAGYGLARELLRDADPGIAALVLLDSLHAATEADGTPLDSQMAPFVAFAQRAQRGEVALWVGHSDVPTVGYESTTETAAELVRLAGPPSGLFHVEAFNVRDAAHAKEEHMAALRDWGPAFVAECVAALTGEAPSPSTQPVPTPVTHGAAPPVLRRGDKGEAVRAWQVELGRAGFRTDVDSSFGPRTEVATMRLQQAGRIASDGIVGPATRAAAKRLAGDTDPVPVAPVASGSLGLALLDRYRAALAMPVVESPPNSNRGPWIDDALRMCGLDPTKGRFNWCAACWTKCANEAATATGHTLPIAGGAGAKAIKDQFIAAKQWIPAHELAGRIEPGMTLVWDRSDGTTGHEWWGHIGIVESVRASGTIVTIEGNSGPQGDRVAMMARSLTDPRLIGAGWL
jgi:hypothetical protein